MTIKSSRSEGSRGKRGKIPLHRLTSKIILNCKHLSVIIKQKICNFSEGGFLESLKLPRTIEYIDTKDPERPAFDIPPYIEAHEDSLVKIRIPPDVDGRFGFNVKGGSDLGMPILVSRVAPNTPADHCYPRLNEGDQV
jgi:PDZ domain